MSHAQGVLHPIAWRERLAAAIERPRVQGR